MQITSDCENQFQYYTEGDTFYIIGFENAPIATHDNKLTLGLPSDMSFDNVTIALGAGYMNCNHLNTDTLTLAVGGGTAVMNAVTADQLTADIGAGSMELYDSVLKDAEWNVGLGSLIYSGVIRGDMTAECGMGSLDFQLTDSEKNHNYSLKGGLGNITIGSHNYGDIEYNRDIDNQASSNYHLSCAMGNITITYED